MATRKPRARGYAVWATAWGPVGAAATDAGLCRVVLPHYQLDELKALLAWEYSGATHDESGFAELVALSRDYFNGKAADFSRVACDLPAAGSFAGKVLRACRRIPHGQTRSYHQLAEMIGRDDAARAVAAALGANPVPLVVPCHRVIYADGRAGGFTCAGGTELKKRMLALERPDSAGQNRR